MFGRRSHEPENDATYEPAGSVNVPETPAPQHRVAESIGLPHPPYLRRVIRRSAGMWAIIRCAFVVVMVGAALTRLLSLRDAMALSRHPGWPTRAVLVVFTALSVQWDRRRAHELILPANLGTRPVWFWGASLLTACATDVVVQALIDAL